MKQQILNYIEENGYPCVKQRDIIKEFGEESMELLGQLCEENKIIARESMTQYPLYQIVEY